MAQNPGVYRVILSQTAVFRLNIRNYDKTEGILISSTTLMLFL